MLDKSAISPAQRRVGMRVMARGASRYLSEYHGVQSGVTLGTVTAMSDLDGEDTGVLVDWGDGRPVRCELTELLSAPSDAGRRGLWIVFEGGDSVGKTTQMDSLERRLSISGYAPLRSREPGGTQLGLELRRLLMHGGHVDSRAEALLYAADRAHHVATFVRPALERGEVVLQDRYMDSSIVYQGMARGLGEEAIRELSMWASGGELPDLTVVLDRDPFAFNREMDRVEAETACQADTIRQGFLSLANAAPHRYAVVDAAQSVDGVADDVWAEVAPRLRAPELSAA